jgi:hypothetical protein
MVSHCLGVERAVADECVRNEVDLLLEPHDLRIRAALRLAQRNLEPRIVTWVHIGEQLQHLEAVSPIAKGPSFSARLALSFCGAASQVHRQETHAAFVLVDMQGKPVEGSDTTSASVRGGLDGDDTMHADAVVHGDHQMGGLVVSDEGFECRSRLSAVGDHDSHLTIKTAAPHSALVRRILSVWPLPRGQAKTMASPRYRGLARAGAGGDHARGFAPLKSTRDGPTHILAEQDTGTWGTPLQ